MRRSPTPVRGPTVPFASQATDLLDYLVGEIRILPPPARAVLPATLRPFAAWSLVSFNH